MAWEPDYLADQVLKDFVSDGQAGVEITKDDAWFARAVTAASRAVDRACSPTPRRGRIRRQFGLLATAEARYYRPYWSDGLARWVCEIDDLMLPEQLTVQIQVADDEAYGTALDPADYYLRPRDALSLNRPYTQLVFKRSLTDIPDILADSIKSTARWGWSPQWPTTIEEATALQANRYNVRRYSPMGVRGNPDDDSEEVLQFKVDVDVQHMLDPYRRDAETLA